MAVVAGKDYWRKIASEESNLQKMDDKDVKPEKEECTICMEESVSVQVRFRPCKHGACAGCVLKLRREVVFKADKGLKCPYCRQYIEGYNDVGTTGDSQAKQALIVANNAAKAAALARNPAPKQIRVTDAVGSGGAAGGSVDWTCNKCKTPNFGARKMCSRPGCTEVAPVHVLQQLMASRGHSTQDLLTAPAKDIRNWATVKLHPNFNGALAEAGMPFDSQAGSLTGDESSVQQAVLKGSHKKLQWILECLLGGEFITKLVFDFYGNYTLQDLIEATKRLRDAVRGLEKNGQLTPNQAKKALGMKDGSNDYLGRLVEQIAAVSEKAVIHAQGNYVLEKILDLGDAEDVVAVAAPLCADPYSFTTVKYGFFKYRKLVDKLGTFAFDLCEGRDLAAQQLDTLCAAFLKDDHQFERLLNYDLGGPMLLEAAQGGLPYQNAVLLLHRVASSALTLRKRPVTVNVLKTFLRLEARDAVCRELIVTNVCIMAQHLEGHYADTVMSQQGGSEIIRRILELLAQEEDDTCKEWTNCILADLIDHADRLAASPAPKSLLVYGLQLPSVAAFLLHRMELIRLKFGAGVHQSILKDIFPDGPPPELTQPPLPGSATFPVATPMPGADVTDPPLGAGSSQSSKASTPPPPPPARKAEPALPPQVHAAAEAQPPLPQAAAAVVQDETEAGEPIPAFSSAPMSQHPIFGSFPNIGITSQQPPASEAGGPNGMDSDQTLGYLSDMLQMRKPEGQAAGTNAQPWHPVNQAEQEQIGNGQPEPPPVPKARHPSRQGDPLTFAADLMSRLNMDPDTQATLLGWQPAGGLQNGRKQSRLPAATPPSVKPFVPPPFRPPGMPLQPQRRPHDATGPAAQHPARRYAAPSPATFAGSPEAVATANAASVHAAAPAAVPATYVVTPTAAAAAMASPSSTGTAANGFSTRQTAGGTDSAVSPIGGAQADTPNTGAPQQAKARGPAPTRVRATHEATAAPAAMPAGQSWTCALCTYKHQGPEAGFLTCAVCCSLRP